MASIYRMPDKTVEALNSNKTLIFRNVTKFSIIERVLTPIALSGGYTDKKNIYYLKSDEMKRKNKDELLHLKIKVPDQERNVQTILERHLVEQLIENLETNGFELVE